LFRTADYMAEIDSASRGIVKDRNRLYWDQFKQMQSPCPPIEEQAAITPVSRLGEWADGKGDQGEAKGDRLTNRTEAGGHSPRSDWRPLPRRTVQGMQHSNVENRPRTLAGMAVREVHDRAC
jgi:hypothetical protein